MRKKNNQSILPIETLGDDWGIRRLGSSEVVVNTKRRMEYSDFSKPHLFRYFLESCLNRY